MHTRRLLLLTLGSLVAAAPAAPAQDAVIFKDGYTILGKVDKERDAPNFDPAFFNSFVNFDFLNSGPRFVFFSRHVKKGAEVIKGGAPPEEKTLILQRYFSWMSGSKKPLPAMGEMITGEFNADWTRKLEVKNPNYPSEHILQTITYLSPRVLKIDSGTHKWRQVYDPKEFGPAAIRKILATHPDLTDGWIPVVDPMKRITIAQFLKEVGWFADAREELVKLKKDAPWAWPKEASDRHDKLLADIDSAETKWILNEVEVMLTAGQYQTASAILKQYQPKMADAKDLTKLADLKAKVDDLYPRYEAAKRRLRELIDLEGGQTARGAHAAVAGWLPFDQMPKAKTHPYPALLDGAEAVFREMHPDSLGRLERFVNQSAEWENRVKAGKTIDIKPESLLALAVTGWLKGKDGARQAAAEAVQVWNTRQMAIALLKDTVGNSRAKRLDAYLNSSDKLEANEIAQIVTLLPPIDAEDPAKIRGQKVNVKEAGVPDVYRIETGPVPEDSSGIAYYVRLPREYHHGRSYPVVIALNHPHQSFPPEKLVGFLASEADRNGFIVAAPEWGPRFGEKRFDYSGKDHRFVSSAIRDLSRKFQIDQDRVFAFGMGEGANFAFDLSMSRPDLLAGVVCMGAFPVPQFYREYWRNAQKCPVYCVTGELAGESVGALRKVYENWLPLGFYAILSVYKGRGVEFFSAEVPTLFDWMSRKRRARGVEVLRQDGKRFENWQTFRETDNRFYWVGASDLSRGNQLVKPERPDNPPLPAEFFADFRNNLIEVKGVRGAKTITVWLEKDMIDWESNLRVIVDGDVNGFRPKKMERDLRVMFEELYRTGDRKMLFFGKLEFKTRG